MANLPSDSFLKPVEPVQASPYQQIDPKALGGLQPLVSDLIQTNAPKNKFLKETYTADPNAIQSRMGEYEAYDPTQFGTMASYLSPLAAASHKGAQFFKKGSVQDALGKLTGFDAHTLSQMSPLLGGLSGVGSMGGNTFYDKTALENQLKSQFGGNFAVMTPDKVRELQATMPEFGTGRFAPTYSTDNFLFYGADALRGVNELAGVYEYLKKINPLRTKTEIWAPSAEQSASRKRWDTSPLRPDPSLGYREISGGVDEFGNAMPSIWARQVQETPLTYTDFMNQYGATPLTYTDFINQYGATPEDRRVGVKILRSNLSSIFNKTKDSDLLQQWMKDPSFLPNFSLYGSGSPEDIQRGFNILQRMSPRNIGEFWGLAPEVQRGMLENPAAALQQMRAMANPANGDWLSIGAEGGFNGIDSYSWDANKGLTVDPSRYIQIDDSNNGLLGSLNSFINKVDPLNGAIENTVGKALGFDSGLGMLRGIGEPIGNLAGAIFSGGIPWGSIVMAADNISTGNDKALMGNLISGVGSYAGANMPTGSVAGTGYSLGSNAANAAANQALISAASTAARGGNFSDILKNAAISGLGSYGGGALFGKTDGALKNLSPLAKMAAQTAYGSGVGGLASMVQGKGFSQGASNAARRGITNAAVNAALNSQLYKGLV